MNTTKPPFICLYCHNKIKNGEQATQTFYSEDERNIEVVFAHTNCYLGAHELCFKRNHTKKECISRRREE